MNPKKNTNFGKYCFKEKSISNVYINYNDNIIQIDTLSTTIIELRDIIKTNYRIPTIISSFKINFSLIY